MAAIQWIESLGEKFEPVEARQASDFGEVLLNFGIDPDRGLEMADNDEYRGMVGVRLFLAVSCSPGVVGKMLLNEPDARIIRIIKSRMEKENDIP